MMTSPLTRLTLAMTGLLLSLSALAGSVSFQLSLTGAQLTVINQGNGSAYYPAVFRLLNDGHWELLAAASAPAELAPGARMELTWPDLRALEQLSGLERLQPVMVRFFDQAGVGFGQISVFHPPPAANTALKAGYVSGILQIEPPDGAPAIRASWVLWPREEGIKPIRLPVRFEHHPPPALRVDWRRQGSAPFQLDTGAGQPTVILIHETAQGYALQQVQDGGRQGNEQRAAWLDAAPKFYAVSLVALVLALIAAALQYFRRARERARPQ